MPRDYEADMRELIDSCIPDGDFTTAEIAEKVLANAEGALLNGWLRVRAQRIMTDYVSDLLRMRRQTVRTATSKRSVFKDAVKKYEETGDAKVFDYLNDMVYSVDAQNTRRRLGDMTGDDLAYVAAAFRQEAKDLEMHALVVEAIKKRVGSRQVRDVYTNEQLTKMFSGI